MRETVERAPLGIRLLHTAISEPDWDTLTLADLVAARDKINRMRGARLLRPLTGFPARGVAMRWREVALTDRVIPVRTYHPPDATGRGALPLVLHVHGGGMVGTATQNDWLNSHLAARLTAIVVSVDHRLIDHVTPLAAAVDDGWDVLRHVLADAERWGVDPSRAAVAGDSAGGLIAAMAAIRARDAGLNLRAQVLVNPCTDMTATMLDYASVVRHADSPALTRERLRALRELAVPDGADARAVSPLHADDLGGLAPALVVVPTIDPAADHGRCYAERLRASGTPARLSEYPGATHAFVSTPTLVRQARTARKDIIGFLRAAFEEKR